MSWDWVKKKYEGKKFHGKVVRLLQEGALVELEPNVVGIIRLKELAWGRKPPKPSDVLSHGQGIEVIVLDVDVESVRLTILISSNVIQCNIAGRPGTVSQSIAGPYPYII